MRLADSMSGLGRGEDGIKYLKRKWNEEMDRLYNNCKKEETW